MSNKYIDELTKQASLGDAVVGGAAGAAGAGAYNYLSKTDKRGVTNARKIKNIYDRGAKAKPNTSKAGPIKPKSSGVSGGVKAVGRAAKLILTKKLS